MTNEEKNIKICEWLGWTKLPIPSTATWGCNAGEKFWYFSHELPNHFTDLNAMHEAEKVLTSEQKIKRVQQLCLICDSAYGIEVEPSAVLSPIEMTSMLLDCTASQRAEAFGKTLNLW